MKLYISFNKDHFCYTNHIKFDLNQSNHDNFTMILLTNLEY